MQNVLCSNHRFFSITMSVRQYLRFLRYYFGGYGIYQRSRSIFPVNKCNVPIVAALRINGIFYKSDVDLVLAVNDNGTVGQF